MVFSLKLFLDLANQQLVVLDDPEQRLVANIFSQTLRNYLELITRAARERFVLVNRSSILSSHLEKPLRKEGWQVFEISNALSSPFMSMMKLIQFLHLEGAQRFPELFGERSSPENRAVEEAKKILICLMGKVRDVQGSRKRKIFMPLHKSKLVKRVLIDEPISEQPSSSIASGSSVAVVKTFGTAKVFSESSDVLSVPLPLQTSHIQLFDPEAYHGSGSEDEEIEKLEGEMPKVIEEVTNLSSMSLASTSKPSTSKKQFIESSKTSLVQALATIPRYKIYPVFAISNARHASSPIFFLEYTTRWRRESVSSQKLKQRKVFEQNLRAFKKILGLKKAAIKYGVKWNEPLCDKPRIEYLYDFQEICLKIFQGTQANLAYYKNEVTKSTQKILRDTLNELQPFLANISNIFLEKILEENISSITSLNPLQVLQRVKEEKTISLATPQKVPSVTTGLAAIRCFTYIFAIHKGIGKHRHYFYLKYLELKAIAGFHNVIGQCRHSLYKNLLHVDTILAGVPLKNIKFIFPGSDVEKKILTHRKLLKILLQGFEENYLYISQETPAILEGKRQNCLVAGIQNRIEFLKTQLAEEYAEEIEEETQLKILPKLIKSKEKAGFVALASLLSHCIPQHVFLEPYIFSITEIGLPKLCFISYMKKTYASKYSVGENLYTQCCEVITNTISKVKKFLESSLPNTIVYRDPITITSTSISHPDQIWVIILKGLTEMRLFYGKHLPELLQGNQTPTLGEELDALIKAILDTKAVVGFHPVKEVTILSQLMDIQFAVEKQGYLSELVMSDHNYIK